MDVPFEMQFMTPDQVAETMDGISPETYKELWGVLDKLPEVTQEQIEHGMTPSDYAQIRCTEQVWKHLSEDAQKNITECVALENARYGHHD